MKAEQAWSVACEQLQMEIPKATFDSWVRDATLVSFSDGEFVVGVANDFTREWLEGRLTSTVTRILTGLMNQSVEVHFIVYQSDSSEEDYSTDGQSTPQLSDEERQLKIQLVHASLRDEFVHPNRVIVIPGYFQRWLPYLGPTLAWIVVAFRQAMFMTTHREARSDLDFEISPASVARWAGIDRSTLWRRLDDWLLGWFLKRTSSEKNSFRFIASMPLTPGDAEALYDWLLASGVRDNPIAALEKSLTGNTEFLFTNPPAAPSQGHLRMKPDPQSVQDIVLKACGRIDKKTALNKVLEMADRLSIRLMPPGDTIHVTHYFLLHHLPALGAAPAWFITLMRDRCYVDKDNLRDTIWMRGGYVEIARVLGLRRPKTIIEWLPPVYENKAIPRPPDPDEIDRLPEYEYRAGLREDRRLVIQQFIKRIDFAASSSSTSWNFKVTLIEPLSSEDQAQYDWIVNLVGTYLETGDRSEIDALLKSGSQGTLLEARMQQGQNVYSLRRGAIATEVNEDEARMQREEARMQPESGANATRRGANATRERRGCNTMRRESNALNSLNLLLKLLEQLDLNSSNSNETMLETDTDSFQTNLGRSVVVVDPFWDLPALFSRNPSIKIDSQKTLVEQKASAQAFVSWLIYAASPSGKGITKPAQFAASKLIGNAQAGAGSIYDRLAAFPTKILYELIDDALSGFPQLSTVPPEARSDWQSVMANASSERILALKHQLFG